jgi:ABC-type branched-subunit amino acid transport system substrate-binding protein
MSFLSVGYHAETGLIFCQAHDRGYDVRLIASSVVATEDFPMTAGPEVEGTLMIATADMRVSPEAAEVVARFRAQGYEPLGTTLNAYAAVQVWAQAVGGGLDGFRSSGQGNAQPPVRHGAGPDRLRCQGRCHGVRPLGMVRLAGRRHAYVPRE